MRVAGWILGCAGLVSLVACAAPSSEEAGDGVDALSAKACSASAEDAHIQTLSGGCESSAGATSGAASCATGYALDAASKQCCGYNKGWFGVVCYNPATARAPEATCSAGEKTVVKYSFDGTPYRKESCAAELTFSCVNGKFQETHRCRPTSTTLNGCEKPLTKEEKSAGTVAAPVVDCRAK